MELSILLCLSGNSHFLYETLYLLFSPHLRGVAQGPMEFYLVFVVTNGRKRSSIIERTISLLYLSHSLFSSAAGITNLWRKDTCTQSIGFTRLTQPDHQICPWIQRVTLKTDFGNTDLALVQLEKSHVAGTFCTDVKPAWHQHESVNATTKPVLTPGVCTRKVPESWGAALLLCKPPSLLLQQHFCTAGARASTLSAVTALPPALGSKIKLTNHQN